MFEKEEGMDLTDEMVARPGVSMMAREGDEMVLHRVSPERNRFGMIDHQFGK